jgi:hypothetical protein
MTAQRQGSGANMQLLRRERTLTDSSPTMKLGCVKVAPGPNDSNVEAPAARNSAL